MVKGQYSAYTRLDSASRSIVSQIRVYEVGSIVTRRLCLWLIFCGIVVLGASELSATACSSTTCGSFTNGHITLSWRQAGVSGLAGVSSASTTNQWGYYYAQSAAYSFLNDTSTPVSGKIPYDGWHHYGGSNAQSYLSSTLFICTTTCATTSHLTFTLVGNATLNIGTDSASATQFRAPMDDAGYYLSTPNSSSSIVITFPSGTYVKSFDFYWGSVDNWNKVAFTDINDKVTTFYGSDLCSTNGTGCFNISGNGSPPGLNQNGAVVDFTAQPDTSNGNQIYPWKSVEFTSCDPSSNCHPAFEFDNIRWLNAQCTKTPCTSAPISIPASVPEPSSLPLLGSGIAGACVMLKRKWL